MRTVGWLLLFICLGIQGSLRAQPVSGLLADSTFTDSIGYRYSIWQIPFVDSMRTDSLRQVLQDRFKIHPPLVKHGKVVDPFDPFGKENFIRKGLGKFWFFLVFLLIAGILLYFRNAFPNQLLLRLRSLFNAYHFRELVSDFGLTFTSGSVVAGLISTLIMAQAIVVIVVYSGYIQLNSVIFYILVVLGLVLWRLLVFSLQSIEAFVLDISQLARSQMQRQINVDLAISLLVFPVVTLAYFNSSYLREVNVSLTVAIIVTVWVTIRILFEFFGLLRENGITLTGILYFCAFEILPHAVLLTALFRRYST